MTTAQIIILSILFVGDFILFSDLVHNHGKPIMALPNFIRLIFMWGLLLGLMFMYNGASDEAAGKCPQYQQIQGNVYQLKP